MSPAQFARETQRGLETFAPPPKGAGAFENSVWNPYQTLKRPSDRLVDPTPKTVTLDASPGTKSWGCPIFLV